MDTLRRHMKEDEVEGRKSWDSGRTEGASPQKGDEETEGDALHQKGLFFLSGSRASVEDQEEETDIDDIFTAEPEKLVKWTHLCQRDAGGVKEEVKTEERIKQQLFSGVC